MSHVAIFSLANKTVTKDLVILLNLENGHIALSMFLLILGVEGHNDPSPHPSSLHLWLPIDTELCKIDMGDARHVYTM